MAITTSATLRASIDWSQIDTTEGNSRVSDVGSIEYDEVLADGSGANRANLVWYDSRSLTSGATDLLDLSSLSKSILNGTITTDFTNGRVKGLIITNLASGSGQDLYVRATGTNPFTSIFNGSGNLPIRCSGQYSVYDKLVGFSVSSTAKNMQIYNSHSGIVNYEIAIIGSTL